MSAGHTAQHGWPSTSLVLSSQIHLEKSSSREGHHRATSHQLTLVNQYSLDVT